MAHQIVQLVPPGYSLGSTVSDGGAAATTGGQALSARVQTPVMQAFPDVNLPVPSSIQTIQQIIAVLSSAESSSVATANRYIAAHNEGRLTQADYTVYDGLRHGLNRAQVGFLAGLRAALYVSVGTTIGDQVMARIPWPGWLPRLERGTGAVAPVSGNGTSGLYGGLGNPPLLIGAAIVAAVAGLAILAWTFDKFADALVRCLAQYAFCRTSDAVLEQRERIYRECVTAGGTPEQCAAAAAAMNADIVGALRDLNRLNPDTINIPLAVGASLAAAVLLGAGIWAYLRKKAGKPVFPWSRGGVSGIRRMPRAKRSNLSRRSRRGVGAIKLRDLSDAVPSRYQLEV